MSSNECTSRLYQGSSGHTIQKDSWLSVQKSSGQSGQELNDNSFKNLADDSDFGTAAVESLLNLKFSESLPVVMERIKKNAQTVLIQEAVQQIPTPLPAEVLSLLHVSTNGTSNPGIAFPKPSKIGKGLDSEPVFAKAMSFINDQFKTAQGKMDIKLFECGWFKLENEKRLYQTQDDLAVTAQDIGLTQGMITISTMEVEKLAQEIEDQRRILKEHREQCATIKAQMEQEKQMLEDDLHVITIIEETMEEECKKNPTALFIQACLSSTGRTTFEMTNEKIRSHVSKLKIGRGQKAFEDMLSEVFAIDELDQNGFSGLSPSMFAQDGDEIDPDDIMGMQTFSDTESFVQKGSQLWRTAGPGGATGATNKAASDDMRERCPIGGKPDCGTLKEKIGGLKSVILNELEAKKREIEEHTSECDRITANKNAEIAHDDETMTVMNVELAKASGTLSNLQISHGQYISLKREICQSLQAKFKECYSELKIIENEICGLMKVRQAVYDEVKSKPGEPRMIIQDCVMGDWVVGPCSSTCQDHFGRPGVQLITRTPATEWDPTTPEGKYGASCPPGEVTRDCANEHCPIDCKISDWSGFSECTAGCGGGQQTRTRAELQMPEFGGEQCPAITETQACGTDACDQDCILGEWSEWGTCSRACKWESNAKAGRQTRAKPIQVATKGSGKCPMPHDTERLEWRYCNEEVCGLNIECVSNLDVILVLDGSGSLRYPYGSPDKNWNRAKEFLTTLVDKSKMATMDKESGVVKGGMRYGVVLFSSGAREISPVTHKRDELKKRIEAMQWPRSMTYTDRALRQAINMFNMYGKTTRKQVILLLTDGRATNRKKAEVEARAVREAGIRLIIISVKGRQFYEMEMCGWTTPPCVENLLRATSYKKLLPELNRYLSTMCPVLESPSDELPQTS